MDAGSTAPARARQAAAARRAAGRRAGSGRVGGAVGVRADGPVGAGVCGWAALRIELADPDGSYESAVSAAAECSAAGPAADRRGVAPAARPDEPLPDGRGPAARGPDRRGAERPRARGGRGGPAGDGAARRGRRRQPASVDAEAGCRGQPAGQRVTATRNGPAQAALSVPGVARLTGALGGLGRAVHIGERPEDAAATLPRRMSASNWPCRGGPAGARRGAGRADGGHRGPAGSPVSGRAGDRRALRAVRPGSPGSCVGRVCGRVSRRRPPGPAAGGPARRARRCAAPRT